MKSFAAVALTALCTVQNVAAHATFQALWVDGADFGGQCARQPASNSPVTNVASNDLRCNAGSSRPAAKCAVKAGSTVTVEMHQQPNDRSCTSEAIGGAHYGPVMVYMSKVTDATTADGSGGWFKIFQDAWSKNATGASGDDDFWGVKDLNKCCGKMSVTVPADLAPGDYLLRAEVIALHTAGSSGGAQLYMTCYQLSVAGSGSATPPTVLFPGAYKAADPGILVNIHAALATYVAPGPTVYAGGSTKKAGSACSGCEATCTAGAGPSAIASTVSVPLPTGGDGGGTGGCTVAKYAQCGGNGYTGCTTCGSGAVCSAVSPPYYSQCV